MLVQASVLALMRLQYGYVADTSNRNGVDIRVALDVSTSMNAVDFKPDRITVAKNALKNFIDGCVPRTASAW